MKFPRLSRKTWIAIGLVVLVVVVWLATKRESFDNSGLKLISATYGGECPGVQEGNVTERLRPEIDGKREFRLDVPRGGLNTIFGDPAPGCVKKLVIRYTCNGAPRTMINEESTIQVLIQCAEATPPPPAPAPTPAPMPPTEPSPSAPPSSATYSASCSKCSVINNQITCACDVLPK